MKRQVTLNLDGEEVALMKAKGYNISEFIRNLISTELELDIDKDEEKMRLAHLQLQNAKLSSKVEEMELDRRKAIKKHKEKIDELNKEMNTQNKIIEKQRNIINLEKQKSSNSADAVTLNQDIY